MLSSLWNDRVEACCARQRVVLGGYIANALGLGGGVLTLVFLRPIVKLTRVAPSNGLESARQIYEKEKNLWLNKP